MGSGFGPGSSTSSSVTLGRVFSNLSFFVCTIGVTLYPVIRVRKTVKRLPGPGRTPDFEPCAAGFLKNLRHQRLLSRLAVPIVLLILSLRR